MHGEIFEFLYFFFCLKIFLNVNGKGPVWHTPCSSAFRGGGGGFEKIEFLVHTLTYSNKGCGLGPQSLQTTYACDYRVCTCKFAKMYHLVKKIQTRTQRNRIRLAKIFAFVLKIEHSLNTSYLKNFQEFFIQFFHIMKKISFNVFQF